MQERHREQSSNSQTSHHSHSNPYPATTNSAAGSPSPMPYDSSYNNDWTAHQQHQYNAHLHLYQSQQYQHNFRGLGLHDNPATSSSYHNAYSMQPDYQAYLHQHQSQVQNSGALPYQQNVNYGTGMNGGHPGYVNHASSSFSTQQPLYQPPQMTTSPSNRQNSTFKSPRQQFSDTLKSGAQTFTPAGLTDSRHHEARRSISQLAALPARPDSAIRAAQISQAGDAENPMLPPSNTQPARLGLAMKAPPTAAPPRPAPSLPLAARFPPLPPIPLLKEDATKEEKELQKGFEAREEALLLRVDALGIQPETAWQVMREAVSGQKLDETADNDQECREAPAPILGIRLLQRIDLLQKENEELESVFGEKMQKGNDSELQDALRLIDALDEALSATTKRAEQAEAKVSGLEKALAIACDERSSAMTNKASSSPPWQQKPPIPSGQSK